MFVGFGTVLNVAAVVVGSGLGLLLGSRLPERTRRTITDALGLVTLLMGGLAAIEVTDPVLTEAVGAEAPVLIVLGSLLIGGIIGSLLDLERRVDDLGGWIRRRFSGTTGVHRAPLDRASQRRAPLEDGSHDQALREVGSRDQKFHDQTKRQRFVEGFVTASMVFCVGPLTVLGSLSDGIGRGADQLVLKAALDGFASIAFAAAFGVGVMAAALTVAVIQGSLTLVGFLLGDVLPAAHLAALTATGGLLLVGVGIRLLDLRQLPVANLMPALVVAPLLVELAARLV